MRFVTALTTLAALTVWGGGVADAQDRRNDRFYYPGSFNWRFLETYPGAARLFNAFDYGHSVLSEVLWTKPDSATGTDALEREYRFLTEDLLIRPPRFEVAEEAVAPSYMRLAWRAHAMFHWAHVLHRQIYDVYAATGFADDARRDLVERITDYYLESPLAFPAVPKAMALMDDQYYSQVFRRRHARFNGLIWAYHWLQVGLYEPLIAGATPAEREAGVRAAVARFFAMVASAPEGYPRVMPMTATIAPEFTKRHPRAAAVFDNLHMMHDIISDILVSDRVPRGQKRAVIYEALAEFQDTTRNVMSRQEWLDMGHHMGGIDAMGGPAVGLLRAPPAPQQHRHD